MSKQCRSGCTTEQKRLEAFPEDGHSATVQTADLTSSWQFIPSVSAGNWTYSSSADYRETEGRQATARRVQEVHPSRCRVDIHRRLVKVRRQLTDVAYSQYPYINMTASQLCCAGHSDLLLSFISFFLSFFLFSAPNLRGRLVDRHRILTCVRWWPKFIKLGQKFGRPPPKNGGPKASKCAGKLGTVLCAIWWRISPERNKISSNGKRRCKLQSPLRMRT